MLLMLMSSFKGRSAVTTTAPKYSKNAASSGPSCAVTDTSGFSSAKEDRQAAEREDLPGEREGEERV